MRKLIPCAVIVFTLLLVRTSARAAWRVDAEGGAFVPTSNIEVGSGEDQTSLGVNVGGAFAGGAGYGLGDWVDLTAHVQGDFAGLSLFGNSLQVFSFTVGGRVYLLEPGMVRPWLMSEIGWYHTNAELNAPFETFNNIDNSFGINAGGGVDVSVTPTISIGVDVRYHNAFTALNGLQFVSTMLNVAFHIGQ